MCLSVTVQFRFFWFPGFPCGLKQFIHVSKWPMFSKEMPYWLIELDLICCFCCKTDILFSKSSTFFVKIFLKIFLNINLHCGKEPQQYIPGTKLKNQESRCHSPEFMAIHLQKWSETHRRPLLHFGGATVVLVSGCGVGWDEGVSAEHRIFPRCPVAMCKRDLTKIS